MPYKTEEVIFFDEVSKLSPENTGIVFDAVKKRAEKLKIKSIVVASSTGSTGVKASEFFKGYNLVIVTHHAGFRGISVKEFTDENREKIIKNGGKILTATHGFSGVGRAIRKKFNTFDVGGIVANVLYLFRQGMKVACEVACMAVDAGLVRVGEEVISIGGTSKGSDTAIVINPTNIRDFFNVKIREIICKPRL